MKFPLFVFLTLSIQAQAWTPCEGDWASYEVETKTPSSTTRKKIEILFKKIDQSANEITQQVTETLESGEKKMTETKMEYSEVKKENDTVLGSLTLLCRPSKLESIKTPAGTFKACPMGNTAYKTWYMSDVTFNLVKEKQELSDKSVITTLLQGFKSACFKSR